MLPFFGNKNVPTVSGRQSGGSQLRRVATRREVHLVFLGLLGLLGVLAWNIRGKAAVDAERAAPIGAIAPVPPLREPRLAGLPALPPQSEIAEQDREVDDLLRSGGRPSLALGLTAAGVAWAERLDRADRTEPPLPQRVSGEDIARKSVAPGSVAVVRGRLADTAPAPVEGRERAYRWLSIALDHDQQLIALVPDEGQQLVLNDQVQVVGRYLGLLDAPLEGGAQPTPLLLARAVVPVVEEQQPSGMKEFQGAVRVPADVFAGVDDERPLLETRSYYYTIGQVKTEAVTPYPDLLDANHLANDIHQKPDEFRGKAFVLRGLVHSVWQDEEVATDRPFDVRRVTRVLMYRRDLGPITENGVTRNKSVLRLFEVALVGDGAVPSKGQNIEVQGRFLKWRAMRVDTHPWLDQARGVQRSSDKVYSMFFVAPRWRELPLQTVDWSGLRYGLAIFFAVVLIGVGWYLTRDRGAERRLREDVVRLRRARRHVSAASAASPPTAAATGEPPPPPTPAAS